MIDKNGNYKFYQRDESNSILFKRPLIKRKKEYFTTFKNSEIKLRNTSTKERIKHNDNYFPLHHYLLCLTKCSKTCKMENFKKRKIPSSIEGLNCDQIDNYLYASQRLTNQLIKKYDLINKLKKLNVGLIVNCEEKGEHPYCGTVYNDGLDECGFAYSIKELEKYGIQVLCCGWVDFVAPESYNHMINVVKKMYYCIHTLNKKVIVHCHAGMGRTGLSLACYKIFAEKINPENARKQIRKGSRIMSLGDGCQFNYTQEFEKYLEIIRENFFKKNKKDIKIFKICEKLLDVGNYKFLYFNEKNYIENVPIFLLYIFDRIIQIKLEQKIGDKTINNLIIPKDEKEENNLDGIINEINKYNWEEINKIRDIKILGELLFKWLNHSINYVINPKEISSIKNFEALQNSTKEIIKCITKFLKLLKDKNDEKNDNLKEFKDIFFTSLLGYSPKDINLIRDMINKLVDSIKI